MDTLLRAFCDDNGVVCATSHGVFTCATAVTGVTAELRNGVMGYGVSGYRVTAVPAVTG